jgi:hypothetical protein
MGGGGGTGGSSMLACQECMGPLLGNSGMCGKQQMACGGSGDCNAWLACYATCLEEDFTPACFDTCDTTYMDAEPLYDPLVTCVCTTCAAECGAFCN